MGLTSLYTAVSGLNAFGNQLSVIGNNISNIGTYGYKASRSIFSDLVAGSLTGGSSKDQVGRGVFLSSVQGQFTQGSLSTTSNALDFAIDGNGFFSVNSADGTNYFSRAGKFLVNKDGKVVDPNDNFLQGYQADASGAITSSIDDITLSTATAAPNETTAVDITANLNSQSSAIASAFSASDATTYNFSTGLSVYDSLGESHTVSLYFIKSAANAWTVRTAFDGTTLSAANGGGTLGFAAGGTGVYSAAATSLNAVVATPTNGSNAMSISLDLSTMTQYGSASAVTAQTQDGYGSGSLSSVSADTDGTITGRYTNGQTRSLAQVVLGRFQNPNGLTRIGKNLFAETTDSGAASIGAPNTGGAGRLIAGSVELSNVDLGEEFIEMISAQRGFQANSKVISTTDQLMEELVNLRR